MVQFISGIYMMIHHYSSAERPNTRWMNTCTVAYTAAAAVAAAEAGCDDGDVGLFATALMAASRRHR